MMSKLLKILGTTSHLKLYMPDSSYGMFHTLFTKWTIWWKTKSLTALLLYTYYFQLNVFRKKSLFTLLICTHIDHVIKIKCNRRFCEGFPRGTSKFLAWSVFPLLNRRAFRKEVSGKKLIPTFANGPRTLTI